MFGEPSPTIRILRAAAGVLIAVGAGIGAFAFLFTGIITATGCFFECTDPNLVAGIPLLAGAVIAAAGALTSLAWGFGVSDRRSLAIVFGIASAGGVLLLLAVAITG